MKEFFKQIAKFICIFIILLFVIEMIVRLIPNSYKNKLKLLENNSESVEALIFGSSHAQNGINPIYFHQKVLNMALEGQGITIDSFVLEKYVNQLTRLKYILLPIDYQTLYMFDAYGSDDRYMYYNIYYGYEPNIFSIDNYEIFHPNSIVKKIKQFVMGNCYFSDDKLGFGSSKKKSINGADETLLWQTVTNFENDTIRKNIDALERIAQIAYEKDLFLLIVSIPTHHTFFENTDSVQELFTRHEIDRIVAKSDKFMYFDYFKMPLDDDDFSDATHLNIYGAEKFSRVLANKLDSLELLNVEK
ncbi:MAG: hypothetical protein IK025_01200 [Bacteroidales bacterium]|nr:hypothetical protein [Bacteroidales bacterium]